MMDTRRAFCGHYKEAGSTEPGPPAPGSGVWVLQAQLAALKAPAGAALFSGAPAGLLGMAKLGHGTTTAMPKPVIPEMPDEDTPARPCRWKLAMSSSLPSAAAVLPNIF